jgi:hypothetical protein
MDKKLFLTLAITLLSGYAAAQDCGFDGVWGTDWGDMTLSQSANVVTGTYTHDSGKITGTVSGSVLKGKWSESPSYAEPGDAGDIEFTISDDCNSFTGKWRYGSTGDWSGGWSGTRKSGPATVSTGVKSAAGSGSLIWKGTTEDKVSPGPDKDGTPDGHFTLTLDVSGTKTVTSILLESADSSGNEAGGQYWDTDPNYYWVLGVEQPAGTRLNPTDKSITKTISGKTVFELYASDSGYFNSGQYFKAIVTYSDGSKTEAITAIGVVATTESQGSGTGASTSVSQGGDADLVVTVGDIDNLGFGWPAGFDVFSGQTTPSHGYPWKPEADDAPGTDVIMVGTGAKGASDGYAGATSKPDNAPVVINMKYDLSGVQVRSAAIQMFVDDFQAPVFGSKFQVTLNGKRAAFMETVINSLSQTGPVGKLITLKVPDEFLPDVRSGSLKIYIDDPATGVGDGYAVDFVRLLVNPKESRYKGTIKGTVTADGVGAIEGATISSAGISETKTKADGTYTLENVPAGLAVVTASKTGYLSSTQSADVTDKSTATLNYVLKKGTDPTLATAVTTTTIAASTGPKDPTAGICKGTTQYIYIEDRAMEKGKEVRIPVIMCNAKDLANMDLSLNYNIAAMKFKSAEKGALNAKSLFESNEKPQGTIKISFASSQGVSGSGSIAILVYDVIGSNGLSSQITGTVNSASTSSGSPISISVNPGTFTVGSGVTGDCDGDGLVSSRDALAALQMAVEKIKIDMCYDVNSDGKVNSADARDILRRAAGGGK